MDETTRAQVREHMQKAAEALGTAELHLDGSARIELEHKARHEALEHLTLAQRVAEVAAHFEAATASALPFGWLRDEA